MRTNNKALTRVTFSIALPLAAQNLIAFAVNMLDTVMLGDTFLTAASLANQLFFIITLAAIYNPNFYFGISGVVEAVGRASGISGNAKAAMNAIHANLRTAIEPGLIHPKADTSERIKMDQIAETVKNMQAKIYLPETDEQFEANVAELYTRLEKIGIQDIEAYYNEAAQNLK